MKRNLMVNENALDHPAMKALLEKYGPDAADTFGMVVSVLGPPPDTPKTVEEREFLDQRMALADWSFRQTGYTFGEFYVDCRDSLKMLGNDEIYFWEKDGI